MKKLGIGLAFLLIAGLVVWRLVGGLPGLVAAALPEFPEFPAPLSDLSAGASGMLHFATTTPFDLDVILDGNAPSSSTITRPAA